MSIYMYNTSSKDALDQESNSNITKYASFLPSQDSDQNHCWVSGFFPTLLIC